jgi:hypothetical protein
VFLQYQEERERLVEVLCPAGSNKAKRVSCGFQQSQAVPHVPLVVKGIEWTPGQGLSQALACVFCAEDDPVDYKGFSYDPGADGDGSIMVPLLARLIL